MDGIYCMVPSPRFGPDTQIRYAQLSNSVSTFGYSLLRLIGMESFSNFPSTKLYQAISPRTMAWCSPRPLGAKRRR